MFWCTWPVTWPDPSLTDRGGVAPATCWQAFETMTERAEHYRTAHPELSAEGAGPVRPFATGGTITAAETPVVGEWQCPAYGCTAPLSRHPVELAAQAAAKAPIG